jgi:D-alanyl-D-alanine carboxypeptidase (penicillin-binding protein 5/6)
MPIPILTPICGSIDATKAYPGWRGEVLFGVYMKPNRKHVPKPHVIIVLFIICFIMVGTLQVIAAKVGQPVNPPPLASPVPQGQTGAVAATASSSTKAPAQVGYMLSEEEAAQARAQAASQAAKVADLPKAPELTAAAAVVMDAETAKVLWAKNPNETRAPASLTKLVTALVALEQGDLNSVAVISANAASEPAVRLGLAKGDRIRLSKLLEAAILGSNNDAATAIAEHVSGTVAKFAQAMTKLAHKIGSTNSSFRNANGLDAQGHYSTAFDLALISRYALQNKTLAQLFLTREVHLTWEGGQATVSNINSFIWRYDGALGLKTGYTGKAGHSVSVAAQNGKRTLIVVLLGCSSSEQRWHEAQVLMDYGFKHYDVLLEAANKAPQVYVVKRGDTLSSIASRYGIKVADIIAANSSLAKDPNKIIVGQKLTIP